MNNNIWQILKSLVISFREFLFCAKFHDFFIKKTVDATPISYADKLSWIYKCVNISLFLLVINFCIAIAISFPVQAQQVLTEPPTQFRGARDYCTENPISADCQTITNSSTGYSYKAAPNATGINGDGSAGNQARGLTGQGIGARDNYLLCPGFWPENTKYQVYKYSWVTLPNFESGYPLVNVSQIPYVEGSVRYGTPSFRQTQTETTRSFQGNGIPSFPTGRFPIPPNDRAYSYYSGALVGSPWNTADKIPVTPYQLNITIPKNPKITGTYCINYLNTLITAVSLNGDTFHVNIATTNGMDAVDPIEVLPLDSNWGHPYSTQYHRHSWIWKLSNQGSSTTHSPLIGYSLDGFGIYGPRGTTENDGNNGTLVTNADLDECHGHIHSITWDGVKKSMYHYHANSQFPYAQGCYRGQPATVDTMYAHDPRTHRVAPRGLAAPSTGQM